MRRIDADALYRTMPLKVCLPCPFGEEKECEDCVIDKVMEVIDESPTVADPRWHRVEEELPKSGEFGEIVLACNDVGTVKAAYLLSNGKWYAANNTDWDAWTWMPNVTHWMPLPEPPKEGV